MMDYKLKNAFQRIGGKGWSEQEIKLLFSEAEFAEEQGYPLKNVFEKVAEATGRKPNSIRNFYYMRLKDEEGAKLSFTPFSKDEVEKLMCTMLSGQSEGKSVRRIAYELGDGDKKKMLRYQNKYRSVLRSDPDYVKELIDRLSRDGQVAPGLMLKKRPYRRQDMESALSLLLTNLSALGKSGERLLFALNDVMSGGELLSAKKKLEALENVCGEFVSLSRMERIARLEEYENAMRMCLES